MKDKLYKSFAALMGDEEGTFKAKVATMGVVDKDGDVFQRGAFGTQKVLVSAFNHKSWGDALPIGNGVITEQGMDVILDAKLFLGMTSAKETYEYLKAMHSEGVGDRAGVEFSIGFVPTKAKPTLTGLDITQAKVYEASPVIVGAGVDTGLLDVKSSATELPEELEWEFLKARLWLAEWFDKWFAE